MKIKLNIEVEGDTDSDIEIALEEVIAKVQEGYLSGFDSNESGSYSFNVKDAS